MNHEHNVVYVKGPVPGHTNTYVRITDARMKPNFTEAPFPAVLPDLAASLSEEVYAADIHAPHEATLLYQDRRKAKNK